MVLNGRLIESAIIPRPSEVAQSVAQYVPEAMIRERGRVRHRLTSHAVSSLRCGVEGVGLIGAVNARAVAGLALAITPGHVHTAVSLQDLRVPNFPIFNFTIDRQCVSSSCYGARKSISVIYNSIFVRYTVYQCDRSRWILECDGLIRDERRPR